MYFRGNTDYMGEFAFLLFLPVLDLNSTEEQFITDLYLKYRKDIYKYAYKKLGNVDDAESATTDAFIRASFRNNIQELMVLGESEVRRHLFGYARLAWLDIARKRERKTIESEYGVTSVSNAETNDNGEVFDTELEDDSADILMLMLKKETQNYLRKVIGNLKPDEQQIIISSIYFEMNSTEIADVMGMNASTVRTKLMRSLGKIKKEMDGYVNDKNQ